MFGRARARLCRSVTDGAAAGPMDAAEADPHLVHGDDCDEAEHPHIAYGCDYCTATEADGSARRIRGPYRYTVSSDNIDCCPACFEGFEPHEQRRFTRLPMEEGAPAPAPAAAPAAEASTYAVWLIPDAELSQKAGGCMRALCSRFGVAPLPIHICLASGFYSFGAAEEAARAAAAIFHPLNGDRLPLRLGPITHEPSAMRCLGALAQPSRAFGDALGAAEAVKKQLQPEAPRSAAVHRMPHLDLLYGDLSEADRATAAVEAARLVGESFEAAAIEVWDVSKQAEYETWFKVYDVPV